MSILNNSLLLAAPAGGAAGYSISRSLRFNSSDSAYLSRTPASAGNRKTWTWAGWVKNCLGPTSYNATLLFARNGAGTGVGEMFWVAINCVFTAGGYQLAAGDGASNYLVSTALFRDPSSWYHIVCAYDSTQATADNRLRMYVNGVEITTWSTNNRSNITLNSDSVVSRASVQHEIGSRSAIYSDCYLADLHLVDGQALTPTSFGEFSATTGVWVPKAYSGPAATGNSFWLPFSDNSAATATTLGKDNFNLGNNWTPNNLSVTAGAGNDSLVDVPANGAQTDTGVGGEVRGNYATLNPLDKGSSITLSNGNLAYVGGASNHTVRATIHPRSGKWYWEVNALGTTIAGISSSSDSVTTYPGESSTSRGYYGETGISIISGNISATWATFTSSDTLGFALDVDAGTCAVYKNNTLQGTWTGLVTPVPAIGRNSGVADVNFGQRPFAYTAPSGFKALNTANLPAPVVTKPSDLFDIVTYVGNGASTKTVSGLAFSPDLVWTKARSQAYGQNWYDIIRGGGKVLRSDITDAELTNSSEGYVSSFTSDGYVGTAGSNSAKNVNENGTSYVGWCWDAGNTTVTNTQGSISSQVRANASAGFSVVTYTAQASGTATIGHGLGVAPSMIILKSRVTTYDWAVYHASLGNTAALVLNLTNASNTNSAWWNNTNPSSTVFTTGPNYAGAGNTVAYCFAPVAGYSGFGSYTGNGSADGPFVYTGFRPKYIMYKGSSIVGSWDIRDTSRSTYNTDDLELYANLSQAEASSAVYIDVLSNGFKIRNSNANYNGSGATYIYAAFAESPFQYARAR